MTRKDTSRADRALELYEKRLPMWVIGERLGVSPQHLQGMIQSARERREKAAELARKVPQWKAGEVAE